VNRAQVRRLLDAREQGRRRVMVVTRATAVAGTALAAVFGVVMAQQATAAATPQPAVAPPTNGRPGPASTSTAPTSSVTSPPRHITAPTPPTTRHRLQPPAQAPVPATGNSGSTSSGGS
jgi:hypothetical protein